MVLLVFRLFNMQDTHQLKNCLFGFLSNISFTSYEFKDLRQSFIHYYPEFSGKKFYSKIYITIRELCELGMIIVDRKNCTYKYSSNYSKEEILNFAIKNSNEPVRQSILIEHNSVLEKVDFVKKEIFFYYSYSEKFPTISNEINLLVTKKRKELVMLNAELNALKNILEIKY